MQALECGCLLFQDQKMECWNGMKKCFEDSLKESVLKET